ncbi:MULTISPECIES: ricin-type beta-trefoil lectin domain protein [unclassified Streptomyces]|uniref:ricin-type beta-trefoil lectin domain protein n=1 Tax=unclassified Streptomyces TaxID=2593676 RepID=UPI00086C99D9|nr:MULTISPECIES: ricin-type beta-trefoil lectin domain protein [unclassified Streptomyces]ODA70328.1 Ricin-type beta-trefoil lectin domain protein [Streptomyces sp. AVP053U2]
MKDTGLSNSQAPAHAFDVTDEQLGDELRKWTGAAPALHPVGELLDRHWESVFGYARLCTDGPRSAGMLTTAAFTRLFGETLRHNGPSSAWRPQLLVTVRRIAAEWDADHRRDMLHPDLTAASADGGRRPAARLLPQPERRLLSGAFQRLPQSARCLLWHTEVESEPLHVPAGLLALDEEGARTELRRARQRLRDEVLQLHGELASDQECRRYLRLLEVSYRRAGTELDPDLRTHLENCLHCRHAADQLACFTSGLGTALAEGVLGWSAREYAQSRAQAADVTDESAAGERPSPEGVIGAEFPGPADGRPDTEADRFAVPAGEPPAVEGESFTDTGRPVPPLPTEAPRTTSAAPAALTVPPVPSTPPTAGAPAATVRTASRSGVRSRRRRAADRTGPRGAVLRAGSRVARKAARRAARRRHLAAGLLTVSGLVVLPLVLWTTGGAEDAAARGEDRPSESPGAATGSPPDDPSSFRSEAAVEGALSGRLHNTASGLCVGVVGGRAVAGAETELTACAAVGAQQWTYETDGLLRNAAEPDLCLDSRLGYSVRLARCPGETRKDADSARYDFTVQGTLVPRSGQDLGLAPAATDGSGALVLKARDDTDAQRWAIDTPEPDLQMKVVTRGRVEDEDES